MGEQNKGGHDHSNDGTKKKKQGDGWKKDESKLLTVVFEVDVHCIGCGSKIEKAAEGVAGVKKATVDCDKNQLTVVGKLDPVKLRDKLESELKKKIELVSAQPKQKEDQKTENEKSEGDKKGDENKSKEQKKPLPATTTVLKMRLCCDGCIEEIRRILKKTGGVGSISFDEQKDLVKVKGTMDEKSIRELLEKKMKRAVEIVPPKKNYGTENNEIVPAGDGGWQARFYIIATMIVIITFFW